MKKGFFAKRLVIVSAAVCVLFFAGCGPKEEEIHFTCEDIAGVWTYLSVPICEFTIEPIVLFDGQFKADGKFYWLNEKGERDEPYYALYSVFDYSYGSSIKIANDRNCLWWTCYNYISHSWGFKNGNLYIDSDIYEDTDWWTHRGKIKLTKK